MHSIPEISLTVQLIHPFYTSSWEQRKAIDIADYSKGNGYSKGDLTDAGTPIILYGRLYTKYQFAINEVDTFAVPRNGAVYSQGNEVIVPASGETAEDIARASAVEKSGVLLGGDLNILRPFDFINPLFLALAISNGEPQKELAKKAQGKSVVHIHNSDIQEVTIAYPSRTEQDRIVSYFSQLDNLITLHQRKCALLFSSFQALISMMFTTSTFSWEQRKLGEIGSVSMCRRIFKEQTSETGDIPFYKIGTFGAEPDAFISRELFEEYKSKYPYPQKGDILISASGSIGRTVEFAGNNEYFQDSNIVWLKHDERLSNPFLKCFYSVVKWAGIEGSTIKRLYNDNILNTVICMPSVPEQERIGVFFENLDHLITLHQRKCISFTGRAGRLISTVNKKRITSSWEQRKLGDIGKARSGVGFPDADQGGLTGVPFFKVSDMNSDGNENEMTVANNYVTAEQIADHRWSPITELPAIFFAKVGAAVMLNRKRLCRFPFLLDNNTMAYSLSPTKWDADFAKALFGTVDLTSLVQVGALPSYNAGDVESMEIYLPSLLEQEQIGAYFKHLDNLITLHQRKPFLMKWRTSDANRNQTNRLVL